MRNNPLQNLIGNTPMVRLHKIEERFSLPCRVYAKVEGYNLTGSIKDRAVSQILKEIQEKEDLKPGDYLIETTSGNTGISLAKIGSMLGYNVIIVMKDNAPTERKRMVMLNGGKLHLVKGGLDTCKLRCEELLHDIDNAHLFGQFTRRASITAHELTTGPEIYKALDNVDYLFAGIGTGGTITGIRNYAKSINKDTIFIGIEPQESPLISMGYSGEHSIHGIGANFIPEIFDKTLIDEYVLTPSTESIEMAKLINEVEGLFVGYTSGSALLAAINYIKENNLKDKDIVVIFPDKGDRYTWN